jgi:hypothetical protein
MVIGGGELYFLAMAFPFQFGTDRVGFLVRVSSKAMDEFLQRCASGSQNVPGELFRRARNAENAGVIQRRRERLHHPAFSGEVSTVS